jgi:upstream activation factor subunit UAF30
MPPKKNTTTTKVEVPETVVVEIVTPKLEVKPEIIEGVAAYTDFNTKLSNLRNQFASLITEFKTLQKQAEKDLKAAQKVSNKRKGKVSNRTPSGFTKPTIISDQLADFLAKPKGSLIARTEVTREINAYIRANKLQDPANGRKINPDAKLKKLLTLKSTDELTYFNLQKFMSQHFQKSTPAVAAIAPTV